MNPLLWASAQKGHSRFVRLLLAAGAKRGLSDGR